MIKEVTSEKNSDPKSTSLRNEIGSGTSEKKGKRDLRLPLVDREMKGPMGKQKEKNIMLYIEYFDKVIKRGGDL